MRRVRLILFFLLFIFAYTTFSYADQETFKGNQISVTFPEDWEFMPSEFTPSNLFEITKTKQHKIRTILQKDGEIYFAGKMIDSVGTEQRMRYIYNSFMFDGYMDPSTKEELLNFHNINGEEIISRTINDVYYDDEYIFEIDEASVFNGENFSFVKVPIILSPDNAPEKQLIYYALKEDAIIVVILKSMDGSLSNAQISESDMILKSFEDQGFYRSNEFLEENTNGWFLLMIILLSFTLILVGGTFLIRKIRSKKDTSFPVAGKPKRVVKLVRVPVKEKSEPNESNITEETDTEDGKSKGRQVDI